MPDTGMKSLKLNITRNQPIKGAWDIIHKSLKEHFEDTEAITLVMMHHGICMGTYQNGRFLMPRSLPLETKYLQSLRVFNENSEAYIWQSSMDEPGLFRGRIICDEDELENKKYEIPNAIDARQLLWGTSLILSDDDPKWAMLTEERGIQLRIARSILPYEDISPENRVWLITRNYIDYKHENQAGYVDCRFVRLCDERGLDR